MRFSLFCQPHKRPILVIGNEKSKVFFWDLQSLEEWDDNRDSEDADRSKFKIPQARKGIARKIVKQREVSIASTTTTTTTTNTGSSLGPSARTQCVDETENLIEGSSRASLKFAVDDPFKSLLPHRTHVVPKVTFAARHIAWSVGGEWMIIAGDQGMMAVFTRQV